jgi:outer membrane protein assembly factor BamB
VIRKRFALGFVAVCLLGAVACETGGGAGPATSHHASTPPSHAAADRTLAPPAPAPTGCGPFTSRRAWIDDVSSAGRTAWQLRLPTDPNMQGVALQPLVIGPTAIVAEENAVYALRLTDGRQLWKRVFPRIGNDPLSFASGLVYGLWQYRGNVIVLVGQVSSASRLLSLNTATGAVRWMLRLGKQGETGNLTLTGDGGIAMIYGFATLTVVDLTAGKIRWGRTAGNSGGPLAAGGVVIAPADAEHGQTSGKLMGYSSRTGKLLWTRTGMPSQPEPQLADGLVLMSGSNTVAALSPATGRTLWTVTTTRPIYSVTSGPSGIAVSTDVPSRLSLIDPKTGRVRWHAPYLAVPPRLDTGTDLVFVDGVPGSNRLRLVDLHAASGSVRWAVPVPATSFDQVLRFGAYAVVIGNGTKPNAPALVTAYRLSTGKPAWTTKVPTFVEVPAAVTGTNLLVQSGDVTNACPA